MIKKIINSARLPIFLFTISLMLSACSYKANIDGAFTEEERTLPLYTQINVEDEISLTINEGETRRVTVQTYMSVLEYVDTYVEDEVLHISLRKGVSFESNPQIAVYLTVRNIDRLDVSGNVDVNINDGKKIFNSESAYFSLSGQSSLAGNIDVKKLEVKLSGASAMSIEGSVIGTFDVNASGISLFNGKNLIASSLIANLSGGSELSVNITEEIISVSASGGSKLYYTGKDIKQDKISASGGSEIKLVDEF